MTNLGTQPSIYPTATASASSTTVTASAIDWSTRNVFGPIKNQGQCGSCWAFSVVGTIESNVAIKFATVPGIYSEQQLVDCCGAKGFGCSGCSGAWPTNAFNYVANAGLANSVDYPYVAANQACRDSTVTKVNYLKTTPSYISASGTSTATKLQAGPLSVCLDASKWGSYSSGVFGCNGRISYNHAVVLVGLDINGNWKIRNSWGTSWG